MKTLRAGSVVALVIAGILLLGTVAYAHTVSFPTSLTLSRSPGGTVAPGTRVRFFGELSSDKTACVNGSRIKLIKIGEGVVATRRTNAQGDYSFRVTVTETSRWRTRYGGEVLNATHPHNHTCEASSSNRIRVRVG
jgi:hypothetical protein